MPARTTSASVTSHVLCPLCLAVNRLPAGRRVTKATCGACHKPLFEGKAIPVDEASFARHLRQNDIPVLVDMWAPWCGPCRSMTPLFEAAARQLEPDMRLLKLNVDEAPETASRLGIRGIPALFLFQGGKVLGQAAGVQDTQAIIRWARSLSTAPLYRPGD